VCNGYESVKKVGFRNTLRDNVKIGGLVLVDGMYMSLGGW
jgi:hypothetical protein